MNLSPRSATAIVYPAAFAMAFALMQVALGLVFFARDVHHAQPSPLGWLAGTWALTYTLGCLLLRPRLRHLDASTQVIVSASCLSATFIAMQFAPALSWLFMLQGLLGLLLSLYWPALMGWLSTGVEGPELGRRVSRFNLAWSTGNMVGPYVCGWLFHLHVRLPLAVGAAVLLGIAIFSDRARRKGIFRPPVAGSYKESDVVGAPPRGASRSVLSPPDTEDHKSTAAPDRSTPLRYPAWIGHFTSYFAIGSLMGTFPVGARDELGYTETWIGLIFLMRALANTLAFFGMGRTSAWHFRMGPMLVGSALAAAAFVGLIGARSTFAIVMLLCVTNFAAGISYSASIFHGASGSLDRSHRMAVHEALIGIGLFVGSAAGGIVYDATALAGVYALSAAVLAAGTVAQIVVGRLWRNPESGSRGPGPPSLQASILGGPRPPDAVGLASR